MTTWQTRVHGLLWEPAGDPGSPTVLRAHAVYPLIAVVVILLGLNWPFMAIGLRSISAVWMVSFRLIGATLTLFAIAAATGRLARPARGDYPIVASVAVFRLSLVFMLVFLALEIVPPGRSSILVWTSSLWTVPIAVAVLRERMSRLRWLGLVAGVGGILFVFEPTRLDWSDTRVLLGHGMLLLAAVITAGVTVHIRSHTWIATPLGLLPWQMLIAAVPITALALVVEGIPTIDWTAGLVGIVVYQGVAASGIAIWGQLTVLRAHPAISTSLALMAVPVVGLTSSAIIVDESLTVAVVLGLVLVLAGVALNRIADARTASG
ncbi:MAG TPA: DMT family transporter [Acidimicrobiia bacterium]|nr:DMT family transporter [Acidimicrobiia bacterium]